MEDDVAVAIAELTTGLHFALVAIIAALHNKRVLAFGESHAALQQALDRLDSEQQASLVGQTLNRVIETIEKMEQSISGRSH
jgi:hypothetical protein